MSLQRTIKRSERTRTLAAAVWLRANAAHLEELRKQREAKARERGRADHDKHKS